MFDKLKSGINAVKDKLDSGAIAQVIDKVTPYIQPYVERVLGLTADNVQDDDKYKADIVSPTLLAVSAASSGATSMIPRFDERFTMAMFHIRDELVIYNDGRVNLIDDYRSRLPSVLEEAFRKSA